MQAEAEHIERAESLQREGDQQSEINVARGKQPDCCSVEQQSSVQDPGAQAQSKQKHTRDQPVYLRQEINKSKTVKTKEAKDLSKSKTEMVDVMDTLKHVISIIEKEMAKNPTFLQKGVDTRNTNDATVALIIKKTLLSISFSKHCQ